jgi:hypothetical protein
LPLQAASATATDIEKAPKRQYSLSLSIRPSRYLRGPHASFGERKAYTQLNNKALKLTAVPSSQQHFGRVTDAKRAARGPPKEERMAPFGNRSPSERLTEYGKTL